MKSKKLFSLQIIFIVLFYASSSQAQEYSDAVVSFSFDGNVKSQYKAFTGSEYSFSEGIKGKALLLNGGTE